ncbi:MAG: tetratricopeptide repeat protein, partial [Candidatus Omnitrophica bacterium]|nr:tetratricopeptide repeat protein [Candidatus Omnitrophota bacterium]
AATVRELYEQAIDAYNQQQYDRAIELHQEITRTVPNFAPAYIGIGLALKAKGADIDEVLYYYKTAVDMDPGNTQALEQLGLLYSTMNNFDKAEKNFLKALGIDPRMGSVKLSLAWLYLMGKSKPEMAIKYFKDVNKQAPAPNVYFGLGMAYFANNERVQALDIITQLRKMGAEDLAGRLEKMVRENSRVIIPPSEDERQLSAPKEAASQAEAGVKVRLRGKLSEVN